MTLWHDIYIYIVPSTCTLSRSPQYYALIELDRERAYIERGREEQRVPTHDMDRLEHTLIGIEARLMLPHNLILWLSVLRAK